MEDEDEMGFFDRLFGADDQAERRTRPVPQARQLTDDELAIERYRYLLRTAPPEAIEQVHAEAFAQLTPAQREQVFRALVDQAPPGERLVSDAPSALAQAATRQELRQPGSMERAFATAGAAPGAPGAPRQQGGPSFGSMFGSSLLGTITGVVLGSAIANMFLPPLGDLGGTDASGDAGTEDGGDPGSETDAGSGDAGSGDAGSVEAAGGDWGGDFGGGDWGGDFGGGDFGGGDFGF